MTTPNMQPTYKAPFPWFGGKSRIAHEVWKRFGNVKNYIEPFFGTGAVLFLRPTRPGIETVNDRDCFLANFWRALQVDPAGVAKWCDWPVSEADLHARHWWLTGSPEAAAFRQRMSTDPEYYDLKIAGWWAWGVCLWIGSGWCFEPEKMAIPNLGNAGKGIHRGSIEDLPGYLQSLADRLRRVRVCCGNWDRITGEAVTFGLGLTGVFLDPPYSDLAGRDGNLYQAEDLAVAHEVRKWAIANGDNPLMRIALCGYEGEHSMPESWSVLKWKSRGGYSKRGMNGDANRERERIWFSPHCLDVSKPAQLSLF